MSHTYCGVGWLEKESYEGGAGNQVHMFLKVNSDQRLGSGGKSAGGSLEPVPHVWWRVLKNCYGKRCESKKVFDEINAEFTVSNRLIKNLKKAYIKNEDQTESQKNQREWIPSLQACFRVEQKPLFT